MTRARTEGFVLVGVVMFVLALTILGMSLYAVSSYEVQFLGASHDDAQALYAAEGGLEMACRALAAQPTLAAAHSVEGVLGVAHAVAMQDRGSGVWDSTGAITFADHVRVVVTASAGGRTRTLQAQYVPHTANDYYKRLFTIAGNSVSVFGSPPVPGSVLVVTDVYPDLDTAPNQRLGTIEIADTCHVWQESADSSWALLTTWDRKRAFKTGGVPVPAVASFYAANPVAYIPAASPGSLSFTAHPAGTIGHYGSPGTDDPDYSFHATPDLEIDVQGTVVWELPKGFRNEGEVTFKRIGTDPATIVIVGSPNASRTGPYADPNVGLWFYAGLNVVPGREVNVVLVSDGQVNLDRSGAADRPSSCPALSIYSKGLFLMGPRSPHAAALDHDPAMDSAIDFLESSDALPHPSTIVPDGFKLIRGSWKDLTP